MQSSNNYNIVWGFICCNQNIIRGYCDSGLGFGENRFVLQEQNATLPDADDASH